MSVSGESIDDDSTNTTIDADHEHRDSRSEALRDTGTTVTVISHPSGLNLQHEDRGQVQENIHGPQLPQNDHSGKPNFFDNKEGPCQPYLKAYPGTSFRGKIRRFNSNWYGEYKWLEYNTDLDACFCFQCRVYSPNPTETVFTKSGYRDWKHAKDKAKGFQQHQSSIDHSKATQAYEEAKMRNARGCPVTASFVSLNNDQKQWLFAVFNVSRFLCANGLAFRGSDESDIDTGDGLFLRAFSQLLFPLEEKWRKIHKNLPKNAKYTSHDIQNEVIEVLASLVKTKIAEDVRKAELFTIMADGTTDKNRKEIQGIVCRYLSSDGNVKERCINVKGIDDRSAKGIFKFIKEALVQFNISVDGLVSQSFDGASVMSGDYGGLQRLISDFCDRNVLYVHCFLHKIHLVVSFLMQNLDEVKEYFDTTAALYKFFKKSAVLESYNGTALKRLIETRWSGHFESTSHVHKNYGDLIQALMVASKNKKLSGEDRAQATGLLSLMEDNEDHVFVFITCMLMDVLKPIDIVVKQLQSPDENLISALHVVNAVKDDIKSKRENNTSNEKVKKMVDDFLESVRITSTDGVQVQRRPTRNTAVPSRFDDFLITDRIPSANNSRTNCQIFVECLDLLDAEFLRRFSEENIALWEAMLALSPSSDNYLDYDALIPLFEYAVNIPVIRDFYQKEKLSREDLEAECRIFSRVFKDKEWPKNAADKVDLSEVANIVIKEHQKGAPVLSSLYKVAITAGFTSTRVECVFSSLTRVDSPQRRSMKTEREANLAYLSFESEVLINDITFDDFYKAWNLKPRALSL